MHTAESCALFSSGAHQSTRPSHTSSAGLSRAVYAIFTEGVLRFLVRKSIQSRCKPA